MFTAPRIAVTAIRPLFKASSLLVVTAVSFATVPATGTATPAPTPPAAHAGTNATARPTNIPELPIGSEDEGRDGAERSALALAAVLGISTADGEPCPTEHLTVEWSAPDTGRYDGGAHLTPVGPAPTEDTESVNGIVICVDDFTEYLGFEAHWEHDHWAVFDVPAVEESDDHDDHGETPAPAAAAATATTTPPPPPPPPAPSGAPSFTAPVTGGIEGYAAYDPQRSCSPSAKPGTASLAALLQRTYPGSGSSGIVRGCSVGGRSEHKEGRAFDWRVNVNRPAEKAAAADFIARLMATDSAGNRHALARRMGIMYVIWNRQVWASYRADAGFRPYTGTSPHTDHVHISMSWAGALGQTSFWSGKTLETGTASSGLYAAPAGTTSSKSSTHTPAPTTTPPKPHSTTTVAPGTSTTQPPVHDGRRHGRHSGRHNQTTTTSTSLPDGESATGTSREDRWKAERERRAAAEAERKRQQEQAAATENAAREARRAAEEAARAERDARRAAEHEARRQAERDRRHERETRRRDKNRWRSTPTTTAPAPTTTAPHPTTTTTALMPTTTAPVPPATPAG